MPSCERCWREAEATLRNYQDVVRENNCSPEEQAGPDAAMCEICHRKTVHQHVHICMACQWKPSSD